MTQPHNGKLNSARKEKNDEFYTLYSDVENEMNAYRDYNKDVFRDKTVLLPCDDPEWSNFTKFFVDNFDEMGLKKLISTSYTFNGSGRIFVLERGVESRAGIKWNYLNGDGDFRSDEITALRDEADMVITNPPFSLYREFVAWLVEGGVEFTVIGNINSITYREVFPLIRDNKMWLGGYRRCNTMWFTIPEITYIKTPVEYDGKVCARVSAWWFTNIDHGRRREKLKLKTMEENTRHSRRKKIREQGYPKYDNYDAIEVAFTEAIPSDYGGVMGVPISFLNKYNPEQFEIVGCSINFGRPHGWDKGVSMNAVVNGKEMYKRIFIRHKPQPVH